MKNLMEKYLDQNRMYSFEGARGVRFLCKIIGVLGYSDYSDFMEDNPGAIEAIVEWIGDQNCPEWSQLIQSELEDKDEDGDEYE